MDFATPAAADGPEDLAHSGTVSGVSSEWSDAFAAENAFDGDPATEWSTRDDGDTAWIGIDLGSPMAIGQIIYQTRSMSDVSAVTTSSLMTADGTA